MKTEKMKYYLLMPCKAVNFAILYLLLTALQIPLVLGAPPSTIPLSGLPAREGDNSDYSNSPHQTPAKFKQYVKDKYKQVYDAESRVKQTSNGPFGDLWIRGDLRPQKKDTIDLPNESGRQVRARAIARSFMDDESDLFGIINSDEIRETHISSDQGYGGEYTHIYYYRFINNIKLQNSGIHITIGPDENIKNVTASLIPVPNEVYDTTKRKTLSEGEIKTIVEADLASDDKSGYDKIRKAEVESQGYDKIHIRRTFDKIATTSPPYVTWEVTYFKYHYTIDAFTGNILKKFNTVVPPLYVKPKPGEQNQLTPPLQKAK